MSAAESILPRLTSVIEELGGVRADVEPTHTTFSREHVFAVLVPAAPTRLDVGLVLPGVEETERLRPAESFVHGGVTHVVSLAHEDEIDGELTSWLRVAYDNA